MTMYNDIRACGSNILLIPVKESKTPGIWLGLVHSCGYSVPNSANFNPLEIVDTVYYNKDDCLQIVSEDWNKEYDSIPHYKVLARVIEKRKVSMFESGPDAI